jgi:hypothetical protein
MGMTDDKTLRLLAAAAAHAFFDSPSGGSRRSKGEMSRRELLDKSGLGNAEIDSRLEILVDAKLLYKRNTGHYGYGDHYVEGIDVWAVTQRGLIHLWTGS